MLSRLSAGYYLLTALTALATSYYLNYLFFLLTAQFGFGDRQNLAVAALHGFVYIFAAVRCGRFAERRGYHTSLRVGLIGVLTCLVTGFFIRHAIGQVVLVVAYTSLLLFIWPALEALVTEHQPVTRIPHLVGLYNCTWSAATAVAYFAGGTVFERLGASSVFYVPATIFVALLVLERWLARVAAALPLDGASHAPDVTRHSEWEAAGRSASPATFLRLAWLANPFSYIAIYTLFAVMPGVASRLGLTPAEAGLFGSVWLICRFAAFVWLWNWVAWHYRFRWLLAAFVLLTLSFVSIMLATTLWVLVIVQVGFGLAVGLIYYSSLFYSMDVGDAKGEHGGIHEAAIGIGICGGPAVGAASLQFFPSFPHAAAVAVSGLLLVGLSVLIVVWRQRPT